MEMLQELFYYLYVVHYNAFVSVYYFILTNVAFVFFFLSVLYVFNKRNILIEEFTFRPMRRISSSAPYKTPQKEVGGLPRDIIRTTLNKERLKLIGLYLCIFVLFIATFALTTRAVLYLGTLMWVVGALSVWYLEGDREELSNLIENQSLAYCITLLVLKAMIALIVGVPVSEWSRSLGVSLPASASGTITGYLPMMFLMMTVGIPLNYLRMVAQKYSVMKNNKDSIKRQAELMRTANQSDLYNQNSFRV